VRAGPGYGVCVCMCLCVCGGVRVRGGDYSVTELVTRARFAQFPWSRSRVSLAFAATSALGMFSCALVCALLVRSLGYAACFCLEGGSGFFVCHTSLQLLLVAFTPCFFYAVCSSSLSFTLFALHSLRTSSSLCRSIFAGVFSSWVSPPRRSLVVLLASLGGPGGVW